MSLSDIINNKFNLTFVYDNIICEGISLDEINEIFNRDLQIHQLEKDLYVIVFKNKVQCQLGKNRLITSIISEEQNKNIENNLYNEVIDISLKLSNIIKDNNLNAYGFNFDGFRKSSGVDFKDYFNNLLEPVIKDNKEIENANVNKFNPDFSLTIDSINYQINLKSGIQNGNSILSYHINAHFNDGNINETLLKENKEKSFNKAIKIIKGF